MIIRNISIDSLNSQQVRVRIKEIERWFEGRTYASMDPCEDFRYALVIELRDLRSRLSRIQDKDNLALIKMMEAQNQS